MRLPFAKYEGLGNDFVIIELSEAHVAFDAALAARVCERHLGVGADGVLFLSSEGGRPRMKVINADGSVPEMCGNGIRCVALHLSRTLHVTAERFEIDTDAGPHACRVLQSGESGMVEVSMRPPSFAPADVPVVADAPLIDAPIELAGQRFSITAVSIGNPHAVTFADVGEQRALLGPLLQAHARFPQGANAGFARVLAPQVLELAVYGRGAGGTRAGDTGACAAAAAAVETGRARRHRPIEVRLPGGSLAIVIADEHARVSMTGPARHVFDGVMDS
jgi:diaminopimelate epimerase